MNHRYREASASLLLCLLTLSAGCAAPVGRQVYDRQRQALRAAETARPVAAEEETLFDPGDLDPEALVVAVLARNPTLEAARQTWRAALADYPQAVSFADPGLSASMAPGSVGGSRVIGELMLSQAFPWPGRRRLAGEAALAEAGALGADLEMLRRELARMTLERYYALYDTERALEINDRHRRLVEEIRRATESTYAVGRGAPQDVFQAEVESHRLERERLALERLRTDLRSALNELLLRPPDAPLPDPPSTLPDPLEPPPIREGLWAEALATRPELVASAHRIAAAEVGSKLARLRSYPDLMGMIGYATMMDRPASRPVIGVTLQIPVRIGTRVAAVEQAEARQQAAGSADARLRSRIRLEVDQARQEVLEADAARALYRDRLLPIARELLESARTGYATGRNDFSALIQAERELQTIEREYEALRAASWRSRAALDQARGRNPGLTSKGEAR